jgi:phosphoglycerate dehydrogenase-like enzyme
VVPRIFIEKGGIVSNWGALCAPMVAEHALLLALAAARNQPLWGDYMQMPFLLLRWAQLKTQTLYGRSVGIHGFGNVARSLIRLLKPFNVRISAYSDGVPPQLMRDVQVVPTTSLGELFTQSEVLFECEALTEHSENSVNAEMLARLPDGAVFVNVGRGAVVSEEALMVEAASGRLRVAVDVCESEPDYRDAAIRTSPRLILSPHIAGPTADQLPAIGRYALANLKRYLYGKSPGSLINLDIYDRST